MPQSFRRFSLSTGYLSALLLIGSFSLALSRPAAASRRWALNQSPQSATQLSQFFESTPNDLVEEVWQVVSESYVELSTDDATWEAAGQPYRDRSYSSFAEAYSAISEMLSTLGDPATRFINPEEFLRLQSRPGEAELGIGLFLREDEETGNIVVVSTVEGSPAYESGAFNVDDILLSIDGISVSDMSATEAVALLLGEAGTDVSTTVQRGEQQLTFSTTRKRLEYIPVKYKVEETLGRRVGYIRLSRLTADAAAEVSNAIQAMEASVDGYVLDLRDNGGGLLFSATDIADFWLSEGTIVSFLEQGNAIEVDEATAETLTTKPVVAIINGGTGSGAEILAAALQENGRASIVGSPSLGANTIQSIRGFPDGSGLAVTISKWLTPNGNDPFNIGIQPDIAITLSTAEIAVLQRDISQLGTPADPQFVTAVQQLQQQP